MSWRRFGAANDRLDWVAGTLGATFVDPNSWIREETTAGTGFNSPGQERENLGNSTTEFMNEKSKHN